jgi:hypothetical protein
MTKSRITPLILDTTSIKTVQALNQILTTARKVTHTELTDDKNAQGLSLTHVLLLNYILIIYSLDNFLFSVKYRMFIYRENKKRSVFRENKQFIWINNTTKFHCLPLREAVSVIFLTVISFTFLLALGF